MTSRKSGGDNLDLSLTGSQVLSARSSKSVNKRPSSSGGRPKANNSVLSASNGYSHEPRKRINSIDNISARSARKTNLSNPQSRSNGDVTPKSVKRDNVSNSHSAPLTRGISNEFLAFFDSSGARPKTQNKTPSIKRPLMDHSVPKTAAGFPGSAESTPRTSRSKRTNTTASNHTRHSIFRPESPQSSVAGDGDSTARGYTPRSTARDYSPQSTARDYTPQSTARDYTPQSTARSTGNSVADRISASASNTPREDNFGLMNNEVDMGPKFSGHYPENGDMIYNSMTEPKLSSRRSPKTSKTQARASTSNHKDLNATNNMLPQNAESRKPPKLELRTMQNSYQNPTYNVNKTPVNEVHPNFQQKVSKNEAEDYIKRVNMAASVIQNAFKRYVRRRKALRASEAAMKRLLTQKREDFTQRQEQAVQQTGRNKELERQKAREEKARQARLAAIEELNKRREEDKQRAKEVAEAEIEHLKATGKVGPKKFVTKSLSQRTKKQPNSPREKKSPRDNKSTQQAASPRTKRQASPEEQMPELQLQGSPRVDPGGEEGVPVTPSHAGTRTTLDDLMSTLKLLEEDEQLPPPPESRVTAWVNQEHDSGSSHHSSSGREALTAGALQRHSQDQQAKQTVNSNSKLNNILSFLDEVETGDRLQDIEQSVERIEQFSREPPPGLLVPSAEELENMEQASLAASEVTNTVLKQRLQLDEKARSVQMLQKALNQQRELTIRHARETEKEMSKRLDVQKTEYEETVQRHLNFIDQLIDDKKTLSDKCETLVTELKQVDKKYSDKIRQMQETHDRELAKVKEMITTQEKVKRERWIEEKTKKIKDLTVKGLEPEIQRLIGQHKSELKKLKTIHEAELLQSDERAGQRYVSMTEELRDQLAREKETACQRERELAAQRYEKQLQAEEEAYQQARRRLYQEVQDEKERLAQASIRQRQEMDKLQRQLEDSHSSSSDLMKREYEKGREEQERRHQSELSELKERLEIEKEAWEQNYMKKQEAWLLSKERELKDTVKQDRDREIELVINRLEDDGVKAREECERAAENRIKRIREKYEVELDELEKSERQAMEKYNQMKAELLEAQGERERLKVLNRQKEQEVDDIKRLSEKLHRERDHVQDVVRQEFADKLIATDEENKRVKQEMAEVKSRHKIEIERMKQEIEVVNKSKQDEMDAVHARVKQAIAKKEEVVSQLKQQYQAALKRADHLEGLLEQQRKQLLSGKK